jgi:Ca2+-transporting ATPase
LFVFFSDASSSESEKAENENELALIPIGIFASEHIAFDPMEVALDQVCEQKTKTEERPDFKMTDAYPAGGKPPIMTHLFTNQKG